MGGLRLVLTSLISIFAVTAVAATETTRTQYIADQLPRLRDWVETNSGSSNASGLQRVARKIQARLKEIGFKSVWKHKERSLIGTHKNGKPKLRILLVGHLDTVFEASHAFQKAKKQKLPEAIPSEFGPALNGPGVADAKGGIVVMLSVLQELLGEEDLEIRLLIAGDEEIGSRHSKKSMLNLAKGADIALVFEPGWLEDEAKTVKIPVATGGNISVTWEVRGKEAHTGVNYAEGKSAVIALAKHMIAFEKRIKDLERKIYPNVAQISGVKKRNVRPGHAAFHATIRYAKKEFEEEIIRKINQLKVDLSEDDIEIQAKHHVIWHPQEIIANSFLEVLQEAAKELDQVPPQGEITLTRSASSFLAASGIHVLDAMGPFGDNYHSDEEVVYFGSAYDRSKLCVRFIRKLLAKKS